MLYRFFIRILIKNVSETLIFGKNQASLLIVIVKFAVV